MSVSTFFRPSAERTKEPSLFLGTIDWTILGRNDVRSIQQQQRTQRERDIYTHDSPARPWDANWQSADVFTRTITHSWGLSSDLLALWFPLTGWITVGCCYSAHNFTEECLNNAPECPSQQKTSATWERERENVHNSTFDVEVSVDFSFRLDM
jgi:hypothetical protein